MVSINMNRDVTPHTKRGFIPVKIRVDNIGSDINITQARNTFNIWGDQVYQTV